MSRLMLYGDVVSVPFSEPSMCSSTLDTPTASEAEAEVVMVPESSAPLDGLDIDTTGARVSRTVTVNEPVAVLPEESVVEQFTVVVAIGKVDPEAGEHTTLRAPSTRSVAVAVKVTVAPDALVASTTLFAGKESAGAVVSRTVTVNVALPVLPEESVAVHVTVVEPSGKVDPEAGEQTAVRVPSTLSVAVAEG